MAAREAPREARMNGRRGALPPGHSAVLPFRLPKQPGRNDTSTDTGEPCQSQ